MSEVYLENVYAGGVVKRYGVSTAINKQPLEGMIRLTSLGLVGDACADTRNHGGMERALHQYPMEHYQYWRTKYSTTSGWAAPGMGENISSAGMMEENVFIGDRYQWGEAIIEVSQPRSPCYKLNKKWGIPNLAEEMQSNGRCGWLYRVIKPGIVHKQYPLALLDRRQNALTVRQVCDIFFGDPLNVEGLKNLKAQTALSASWLNKVVGRLESGRIENWKGRLNGVS